VAPLASSLYLGFFLLWAIFAAVGSARDPDLVFAGERAAPAADVFGARPIAASDTAHASRNQSVSGASTSSRWRTWQTRPTTR